MPVELNIEAQGVRGIDAILSDLGPAAQTGLRDLALTLRRLVKGGTPVGIGPTKGELKASWTEVEKTSTGFTFGTDKEYSEVVEEGKYTNVGPRTMKFQGGIYSRQAPGGMIAPVISDEAVINKALKNITTSLIREMRSATT